ncbi:hypothetical protein AB8B21_24505 [Tardiphaga sp. 866_E4_N2_1]|uniref:hypothetical protein n=1 Tax=unclassified Tardiphaga TaxID=2631404 RepID=UPI003F1FD708
MNAAIGFINDAIDAMQAVGVQRTRMRRHDESYKWNDDYYDRIAQMIFKIIGHAASLKTKILRAGQFNTVRFGAEFQTLIAAKLARSYSSKFADCCMRRSKVFTGFQTTLMQNISVIALMCLELRSVINAATKAKITPCGRLS